MLGCSRTGPLGSVFFCVGGGVGELEATTQWRALGDFAVVALLCFSDARVWCANIGS